MKQTVIELIAMLETLPADMPVEFDPISAGWHGAMRPLRVRSISFFTADGDYSVPSNPDCVAHIYLYEDSSENSTENLIRSRKHRKRPGPRDDIEAEEQMEAEFFMEEHDSA